MRFFTSDLHFGHARIVDLCHRPFSSVDHMNTVIMNNWNNTVSPKDHVYVLGDVAMGKINHSLDLCSQLNGTKFLIPGNHDRCWPKYYNKPEKTLAWRKRYINAGFIIMPESIQLRVNNRRVGLCHFPFSGDSQDEDRFADSRPPYERSLPLLHGHVHEAWKAHDGQFNVGVDVNDFYPVSEDEIVNWLKGF